MTLPKKIKKQSQPLIELLETQCSYLEKFLGLTRDETLAATRGDFAGVLKVSSERAVLGEKLETIQRQISRHRQRFGETREQVWQSNVAVRMSEAIRRFMSDKEQTQFLISVARQNSDEK
ncbi:MAG: hypothetical protein ABI954_10165 [Pyrinomonadaceae bacterium]